MINIADYKGFYLQKGTDTVKESNAEWGIVVQKFDWSCMILKPKEYASTDFKDQNGKDTFVPQVIKFESGTMKLTFLYIGAYNTFYQKLVEFQMYLANGGEFKFQDKFSGVGRQKVRWTNSDAPNMISKSEVKGDAFTFGMTFVFEDPVTNVILAPLQDNPISISFGEATYEYVPIVLSASHPLASDLTISIKGSVTEQIIIARGEAIKMINTTMGGETVDVSLSPVNDDIYEYHIPVSIDIPKFKKAPELNIINASIISNQGGSIYLETDKPVASDVLWRITSPQNQISTEIEIKNGDYRGIRQVVDWKGKTVILTLFSVNGIKGAKSDSTYEYIVNPDSFLVP